MCTTQGRYFITLAPADLLPALPAHELAVHRDDLAVNDLIADSAPVTRYATSKYFVSA